MKVVLSNDVEVGIPTYIKLQYLKEKFGNLCAFAHDLDFGWLKLADPFSVHSDNIEYVRFFTADIPQTRFSNADYIPDWFENPVDIAGMQIDSYLRIDDVFINVVEKLEWEWLRVEEFTLSTKEVIQNIKVVGDREFVDIDENTLQIRTIESKVKSGNFFEDYTLEELMNMVEKLYDCKSVEEENKLFKLYAKALYDHLNYSSDFEVITLKECIEDVKTNLKDEFIKRILMRRIMML